MITINPTKLVRNVSKNGEFIFRGGLALQAELGAQNVQRFANFLTTPRGRTFALRVESTGVGTKFKLGTPQVNIVQDGRR